MQINRIDTAVSEIAGDAIVVGIHSDCLLGPNLKQLDEAIGGTITRLIERTEITGKRAEVVELLAPRGLKVDRLMIVGLGDRARLDAAGAFQAAGAAAKRLAAKPRKLVTYCFDDDWGVQLVEAAVCGAITASQGQDLYRKEKKLHAFEQLDWRQADNAILQNAEVLGESINMVRHLVNEAPSILTPARFAEYAEQIASDCGLEIENWDKDRLEQERCQSLLAVARGSANPPHLVILKHQGSGDDAPTLALVGKGVTFDSGGLSLKPSDSMKIMKCDMAGAATVLGVMVAIARLNLPIHVVGLVGLVENMISGASYKLGDVLKARNGKTIEVLNTDAEGRLVLADVLDIAVEKGSKRIIDLATLTGACMVALGTDVAGVMTNNQTLCDQLIDASGKCGEPLWQLPMFSEYGELVQSDVADIKNISDGRWGGAITAAKFLENFVADKPWVHVDIAGPAFAEKPTAWLDAGGTGTMVRTLVQLARQLV